MEEEIINNSQPKGKEKRNSKNLGKPSRTKKTLHSTGTGKGNVSAGGYWRA